MHKSKVFKPQTYEHLGVRLCSIQMCFMHKSKVFKQLTYEHLGVWLCSIQMCFMHMYDSHINFMYIAVQYKTSIQR